MINWRGTFLCSSEDTRWEKLGVLESHRPGFEPRYWHCFCLAGICRSSVITDVFFLNSSNINKKTITFLILNSSGRNNQHYSCSGKNGSNIDNSILMMATTCNDTSLAIIPYHQVLKSLKHSKTAAEA